MSVESDTLLRDALALSTGERAEVAAELLASLDEPAFEDGEEVRTVWAEELEWRGRRAVSGEDVGEAWPALRDRVHNKLVR